MACACLLNGCTDLNSPDLSYSPLTNMTGNWETQLDYTEDELNESGPYKTYWHITPDTAMFYAINQNGTNYCYHKLSWIKSADSIYRDVNSSPLYCGYSEREKMNVVQYVVGFPGEGTQTNTFFVKSYSDPLPPSNYPGYCVF